MASGSATSTSSLSRRAGISRRRATNAYGVYAGSNTTISNASTTITTSGVSSHGINLAGSGNTISKVGAITTSGDRAYGVYSASGNTIYMLSGDAITTSGAGAHGIYARNGNTISTSGTITTSGDGADGIDLDGSGNEVTNYGTITASGTGSVGIYSTGGNTITTHGKISGDQYAIYLAGTGDTVNFMQGMTLVGDVYVADADNTFFFGDDLNATITVSGVLPTNVSGEDFLLCDPTYYVEPGIGGSCTILVTDPTGFAMLDEMLDDATGPVFEAVGRRLKRRTSGAADVATVDGMLVAPAGGEIGRAPVAWARSYGSYRDQEAWGDIGSSRHSLGGLVTGIDGKVGAATRAGALIGATTGELASASQDTGWQSLYAGLYAGREVGEVGMLGLTVIAGGAWYDSERTIIDNTSATGRETAEADYTAAFVSPELSLQSRLAFVSLKAAARYAALFVGDYEEDGSSSDLSVDARTIHMAGMSGTLAIPYAVNEALALEPYVGLEGRYASSPDVAAEAVALGQSVSLDADGDKTVGRLFAGAAADYQAKDAALSLRLNLRGTLDSDGTKAAVASLDGELRF